MGCLNSTGNCRHIAAGRRRDGIYKRRGTMKTWTLALGIVALALVSTATAADPTGTWK
jgi:hypothetical protein